MPSKAATRHKGAQARVKRAEKALSEARALERKAYRMKQYGDPKEDSPAQIKALGKEMKKKGIGQPKKKKR